VKLFSAPLAATGTASAPSSDKVIKLFDE
jgi:hypothetical protein